jgi:hypothetical protein
VIQFDNSRVDFFFKATLGVSGSNTFKIENWRLYASVPRTKKNEEK